MGAEPMTPRSTSVRSGQRRVAPTMGTMASIVVHDDAPTDDVDTAIDAVLAELERLEAIFSTYRANSVISAINRGERHPLVPGESQQRRQIRRVSRQPGQQAAGQRLATAVEGAGKPAGDRPVRRIQDYAHHQEGDPCRCRQARHRGALHIDGAGSQFSRACGFVGNRQQRLIEAGEPALHTPARPCTPQERQQRLPPDCISRSERTIGVSDCFGDDYVTGPQRRVQSAGEAAAHQRVATLGQQLSRGLRRRSRSGAATAQG